MAAVRYGLATLMTGPVPRPGLIMKHMPFELHSLGGNYNRVYTPTSSNRIRRQGDIERGCRRTPRFPLGTRPLMYNLQSLDIPEASSVRGHS